MTKVKIFLITLFCIQSAFGAGGVPASFKGKAHNPCEVAFVKLLNGKIPSESSGNASLNLWDERFNPQTLIDDIEKLTNKESRIGFIEELQKLVHNEQGFVDNFTSTVSLMVEKKLISYDDIQKYFLK